MYKILKSQKTEENTEIRLAQIESGYTVGLWDCDENQYYYLRVYPNTLQDALEKAVETFQLWRNNA